MGETVIEVRDLVKTYGDLRAVDGIGFDVEAGEVFAFLGPNGAGKTTTVEIIETIRQPTSGSVTMLSMDIARHRKDILTRIGVLPQEFSSYDRLTVRETVRYFADLFSADRDIAELLELVNLGGHAGRLYGDLSGGLKQRVGMAVALVNDPEIVFLDEPTTGLDPKARHDVWDVIRGLKARGRTVFLTTHYMEEAEALADRVAIISRGRIIARGAPSGLIDGHFSTVKVTIQGGSGTEAVAGRMGMKVLAADDGGITVEAAGTDQILDFLNELRAEGISYSSMDIRKPNLEELFLALTGEALADNDNGEVSA